MTIRVGQMISNYQIAEEIGRGGMAAVYRAYQQQLERWVAVKILHIAEASSEEFLDRFRREARAIAALRHPNILTIYDYGEEHGIAYIVMEYVSGGTLKARLTGQPLSWREAARLAIPLGQALAYAHSRSIVHRDLKPANIFLPSADWPLLGDFGLVKLIGHQRGITRPGVSVGTPAYFSPEQAAGDEVDHRTDIYGFGLLLYEMVTGRLPFEGDSVVQVMLQRLQEPPCPPRRYNPAISPSLEAILLRALAIDPAARYQSMEKLVQDLASLPGTEPLAPPGQPVAPPSSPTARLDAPLILKGARLVIVATGATISMPAQEEILVGRSIPTTNTLPSVDLAPHGGAMAGVSRHHARFLRRADGWFLEDLYSTNGTYLNEVIVPPGQPARLRHGDIVRFGKLSLSFYEQ